ncbi:MAG: lmo0937 family membrane protein [Chloroflexota bacterium]|nr:lmo0937 family membrane protein [Chloroflexota bacterium]
MSLGGIFWLVAAVIVVLWLIGLVANVAGNLIHLLLLVALAVVVYNLIAGRRAT